MKPVKHFMDCWDYSTEELLALADLIRRLKKDAYEGTVPKLLQGQSIAMIFNGNSTRTRISFEVAAQQLENQQLAQLNQQAVMAAAMAQQAALLQQLAASSASSADAAMIRTYTDMCVQLQALIAAKQQAVLLYQQQADPAVCQQALLNVQNLAAAVQQSTAQLALYES